MFTTIAALPGFQGQTTKPTGRGLFGNVVFPILKDAQGNSYELSGTSNVTADNTEGGGDQGLAQPTYGYGPGSGYIVGRRGLGGANSFEDALFDNSGKYVKTLANDAGDDSNWNLMAAIAAGGLGAGALGAGGVGAGAADASGVAGGSAIPTDLAAGGSGYIGVGSTADAGLGSGAAAGGLAAGAEAGATPSLLSQIGSYLGIPGAGGAGGGGLGGALNWSSLIGNGVNALVGANAANKAADAQAQSASEANALAKYMYDTTRSDNEPARQAGIFGLGGQVNLLKNPGSITSDPGYQFGLSQGTKALDTSAAARGSLYSGAQGKALQQYGQDYASTKLNDSFNRYGALAGTGQVANASNANAGQAYSTTAGNNITGAGNARASGYVGTANALAGGINGYLNQSNQQSLIDLLRKNYSPTPGG